MEKLVTQKFSKLSFQRLFWAMIWVSAAIYLFQLLIRKHELFSLVEILILATLIAAILLSSIGLILTALPGWNYLLIDENGFKFKFGRGSIAHTWRDCGRFFAVEKDNIFLFRKKYYAAVDLLAPTTSHKALKSLSGGHIVFVYDHGIKPSDLVEILNNYRDRNIAQV